MGFSVSGASAILLVGLLLSAGTLYPVLERTAEERTDAVTARDDRTLRQQNTAVGDPGATYDAASDRLTVTIRNAGTSTLSVAATDLVVDGRYASVPPANTSVAGRPESDVWASNETLTLTVSRASAPERVVVVTGPGVAASARVVV
ncbi:flagellar protein FlaF [Halarchaeum solikamskense]|uniref:fla cluster protein FlaF n=1 Tax=Halarchaeum nitratireducens TaxID=489913 RepID=UPI001B3B15EF|nr:fla cluster protein FlaF [Halarchaeum solikamskense]MBP2252416.1 flagellar protein FlaF [Halarchaeum solikamskense]